MKSSLMRISNKRNRICGQIASRLFPKYQKNPGWLTRNAFAVGDGVAVIRYRARNMGDWGAIHQVSTAVITA